MIIFLLAVIAIGTLLTSEEGKSILKSIFHWIIILGVLILFGTVIVLLLWALYWMWNISKDWFKSIIENKIVQNCLALATVSFLIYAWLPYVKEFMAGYSRYSESKSGRSILTK